VLQKEEDSDWVKKCMEYKVEGARNEMYSVDCVVISATASAWTVKCQKYSFQVCAGLKFVKASQIKIYRHKYF